MTSKRAFDLVVGTVFAVLATPVILILAAGLAVCLRTWPFFLQERVGQFGRPFRILKLRTLPASTPRYALKPTLDFASLPRLAAAVRRTHLDELPQLFCVLAGRLSIVGPRPRMPDEHEPVDTDYAIARQSILQGCTGLWQIGRNAHRLPHEAPQYDYFYLEHRSVRMDAWICLQTALLMFGFGSGVALERVPQWALRREDARILSLPELSGTELPAAALRSTA